MLKPEAALRKDRANRTARNVLQHRHFAVIAGIIQSFSYDHSLRRHVADRFANKLAETHSNFDRDRFIKACLD